MSSYGNAFSSQHQSKAGIWRTTIKRLQCDNNSLQRWGTSRRENLAIFPLLCHSSYSCLTQFEHGTCTGFACSLLSPCTQAIFPFYSLVSENLPLAFDPKSNNSNQTSYCLIPDFLWLLTFPTLTLSASLPQRMQAVTPFSAKCPPVLKCSLRQLYGILPCFPYNFLISSLSFCLYLILSHFFCSAPSAWLHNSSSLSFRHV